MPKSLPASIVIDLNPTATVGPVALLQGQGNIAKFSPATRVEQIRFGGFNCSASIDAVFACIAEMAGAPMTRLCALADSAAGKL